MSAAAGKRILLTGGTGFLGSHLARRLTAGGHAVSILKRTTSNLRRIEDLKGAARLFDLDRDDLEKIFREGRFDVVVHCATNYGRGNIDPLVLIEANLSLPLRLLMKAIDHQVPAFINTDTILDKRIGSYSLSKKQFLEWMEQASSKIICLNVALEHFFGPGDDPSKFVSFIIREILTNQTEIALTPGEQKRDFIYIDDVVSAFEKIVEHSGGFPKGLKKLEVGSGRKLRLRAFVELVKELTGNKSTKLNFGALPYRENEVMDTEVDLSGLIALDWEPRVSLEEGLRLTIAHEQSARK